MKINRIKKIIGVGTFANFKNGGNMPFGNHDITVFYGENTVGKTTLVDIFRSVCEGESKYILDRITIPDGNTNNQQVELSVLDGEKENNTTYKIGKWDNDLLKNKLYIFDQKFIQDNIFEGIKQTRDNKTNFTNLVLGTEGVKISQEIEEKKEKLSKYPQRLSQASPNYARYLTEAETVKFCKLKIDRKVEELEQEKIVLNKELNKLQKVNTFRSLQEPSAININNVIIPTLEKKLKKIAESKYDSTVSAAIDEINKELEKLHKTHWIEEGIVFLDDKNCPFCSQSLTSVRNRIDAYKTLFDTKFKKYKNNILSEESDIANLFDLVPSLKASYEMRKNIKLLRYYDEYITWPSTIIYDFDTLVQETENIELDYNKEINKTKKAIEAFINEKNNNINDTLEMPNISALKKHETNLLNNVKSFNEALRKYSAIIKETAKKLENLNNELIKKQTTDKKASIVEIDKQIDRINQDAQCKKYLKIIEEREELKKVIKTKQDELDKEQTEFLEGKFKTINDWFERLGSRDFVLSYKSSRKGNKPTCNLTVKYKSQEIEPDNFKSVFSESDRRNLALSIFLTCAEDKTKILVLDDPVVSFDDNRILMTVKVIKELSNQFCQILITTHYKPFVIWMVKQSAQFEYLELTKNQDSSMINLSDCSEVALSDYEKQYIKIKAFANGEEGATNYNLVDFRKFLENHINIWYQPYISDRKMQLKDKLEELFNSNIITQEQFDIFNRYREQFNPDGHEYGSVSNTELKNIVNELLKDLYGKE